MGSADSADDQLIDVNKPIYEKFASKNPILGISKGVKSCLIYWLSKHSDGYLSDHVRKWSTYHTFLIRMRVKIVDCISSYLCPCVLHFTATSY